MKYIKADVTDQPLMHKIAHDIAVEEGHIDVSSALILLSKSTLRSER